MDRILPCWPKTLHEVRLFLSLRCREFGTDVPAARAAPRCWVGSFEHLQTAAEKRIDAAIKSETFRRKGDKNYRTKQRVKCHGCFCALDWSAADAMQPKFPPRNPAVCFVHRQFVMLRVPLCQINLPTSVL